MADLKGPGRRQEATGEIVGDLLVYVDVLHGNADLTRVREATHDTSRNQRIEISVRLQDHRAVGTQLQSHPSQPGAGTDFFAHRNAAGERDHGYSRVSYDGPPYGSSRTS